VKCGGDFLKLRTRSRFGRRDLGGAILTTLFMRLHATDEQEFRWIRTTLDSFDIYCLMLPDKLPAFSGIVKLLHATIGSEYITCLWSTGPSSGLRSVHGPTA